MLKSLPLTHTKDQPRESYKNELKGGGLFRKNLRDTNNFASDSRIVGGNDADIGKYPFFVEWQGCGASLIHTGTKTKKWWCHVRISVCTTAYLFVCASPFFSHW
jgi:hypothetical protein